jgi:excisionase family DNA binding protein
LGTSQRHVRRLADERRIPIVKVGRYVRFDGHELEHWIDDHRIGALDPGALARGARRRRTGLLRSSTADDRHGPRQRTA